MADEPRRGRPSRSSFLHDAPVISEDPDDIFVSAAGRSDTFVDADVNQSFSDASEDGADHLGGGGGEGGERGDGAEGGAGPACGDAAHEAAGPAPDEAADGAIDPVVEDGANGAAGDEADEQGGAAPGGGLGGDSQDHANAGGVDGAGVGVVGAPETDGQEGEDGGDDGAGGGSDAGDDDGTLGAESGEDDVGGLGGQGVAGGEDPGGAGGSDDGNAVGDGPDAPPRRRRLRRIQRPRRSPFTPEELKEWFAFELRVLLEVDARVAGNVLESRIQGAGVSCGGAFVTIEAGEYIVTWGSLVNGHVIVLCSCGGVLGRGAPAPGVEVEHPELLLAMGKESSCRHAAALRQAYCDVSSDTAVGSLEALFQLYPSLSGRAVPDDDDDWADDEDDDDPRAYKVGNYGRKSDLPVYAVRYEGAWAPVVAKPRGKRHRLAFCFQLSCAAHAWSCIHAKTINRLRREEEGSGSGEGSHAASSLGGGSDEQSSEESEGENAAAEQEAEVAAADAAMMANRALKPRRRARNMFPCRGEVAMCTTYHTECDLQREAGIFPRMLEGVFVEEICFSCNAARGQAALSQRQAELYTVRGRMLITVADWICGDGHPVGYDGAEDALFVYEPRTVYTRVFLDAILEACVIGRTTMSAAAELWTSTLRNSAAYEEGEFGPARQGLSGACGEYSDTLIVPDLTFTCTRCGEDEAGGGSFSCVLCDGQVLSVLADHIVAMRRPGQNCPRAPMPITFACAVRNAVVRAVIRRRVRAAVSGATPLSAREREQYRTFAAATENGPPLPPPLPNGEEEGGRTREDSETALLWAASHLFSTFFVIRDAAELAHESGEANSGSVASDAAEEAGTTSGDDDAADSGGDPSSDEEPVDADDFGVMQEWRLLDTAHADVVEAPDADVGAQAVIAPLVGVLGAEAGTPPLFLSTPSPAGTPPPNPDTGDEEDPLQFLLSAPQEAERQAAKAAGPLTADEWSVPLSMIESVADGAAPSASCVFVDPAEFHSALTLKAVEATSAVVAGSSVQARRRNLRPRSRGASPAGEDDFILRVGRVPLKRGDFRRILPGEWLTDQVMNAFVELLRYHRCGPGAGTGGAGAPGRFYFFNSYFYSLMNQHGRYQYAAVRRWTSNRNVLDCETVFIPVNVGNNHWVLCVVEWSKGVVGVYDSLGSSLAVGNNVAKWVADEASTKGLPAQTIVVEERTCIQQPNGDDCGVFVCMCMELLARDMSVLDLSPLRGKYYRRRIAAQILSKQLLGG